jgi:Caspase domain
MGKRLAIVIAVEKYADTRIHAVKYAEADAKGFAKALGNGGPLDTVFLLSVKATRTTINSQVRLQVKALTKEDYLYIFYAGHGFSKNGHNYITCYDTDLDDLEDTSIRLKELLDACGKSACNRIALFLDSCESGITDLPDIRGIYATMSAAELDDFFRAAEYRACFASCKTSESSYSSDALKHGVWTYQVIEALEGNARTALEEGRYVTAFSLQNYLAAEIQRTLRKAFSKPLSQTPWVYGSQSQDFVIADLDDVLKKRAAVRPGYDQVKRVFLQLEEPVEIRSLSGFIKGRHRVPEWNSSATQSFVEDISQKEIEEEIEEVHRRIRANMNYKRKNMFIDAGHIVTPDFEFWAECNQDAEDPAAAVISHRLTNISPKIIDDEGFNQVFDGCFEDITFEFKREVDVKDLIDQLEELDAKNVDLDYPADCSYCDLTIEGSNLEIRITANGVTIHAPQASAPKKLVQSFISVQKALAGSPVQKAIAASSKK